MAKEKIKENKAKKLVLLDSHAILHRAYHALPDFASSKGEPTGALYGLTTMLMKIVDDIEPDYIVACYDLPGPTFRNEVYKEYKAGRKKAEDDLISQMKRSRDIFKAFNIPIYDKPGFEADDMLGTIVEQMKDNKDVDIVIASGDMDTLQLVKDKRVQVYTLKKGIKDTIFYDENKVKERYGFGPNLLPDYKGLRGDPSDNIIGIAGIGEKTATILITTFGSIENIYKELAKSNDEKFKEVGITDRILNLLREGKEEAEFSKMLATIRRNAPIEFALPKEFKEGIDFEKIKNIAVKDLIIESAEDDIRSSSWWVVHFH
jgi:DNA polymerase-1